MKNQTILILDFGGQYKELIARRVRECSVYSRIEPYTTSIDEIKNINPIGIIFTGGPNSVYGPEAIKCDKAIFELNIPILGICYGAQLIAHMFLGKVEKAGISEYGSTKCYFKSNSELFFGLDEEQYVLMSHTDKITSLGDGFEIIAHTDNCPIAAYQNEVKKIYGVQFHPEVEITKHGLEILHNFLYRICMAKGDYSIDDYLNYQINTIREKVGTKKVLLGLSGGVDSSVCAALLSKAIGDQLVCVYIDHGFMRKGETEMIKKTFGNKELKFICVDAEERFLNRLKGVIDPEEKRKAVGDEFVKCFEDVSKQLGNIDILAQGTIYPDIVESGKNKSAVIKSHHNVGGLPENMQFEFVVEPLAGLFKDEVRRLGKLLDLPDEIVYRQPFPGPGLSIRVIGEITKEKLDILRDADKILREEIDNSKEKSDQYFVVLTNSKSVGVIGDFRNYGYVVALRAVVTNDFMTCEYSKLSYELLSKISSRITNEVRGISRVVYDITSKPPATIEWE